MPQSFERLGSYRSRAAFQVPFPFPEIKSVTGGYQSSFSTTNRCSSNCSTIKRCGISRCGSSCGGTKLGPSYCKKRQTGAQCLKEGPVLGPISRGWFWSLWPYFDAPVMPFANQTRTVIHLCLFSCSHQFPGSYKCSEAKAVT
jgi:hypothetical protein